MTSKVKFYIDDMLSRGSNTLILSLVKKLAAKYLRSTLKTRPYDMWLIN